MDRFRRHVRVRGRAHRPRLLAAKACRRLSAPGADRPRSGCSPRVRRRHHQPARHRPTEAGLIMSLTAMDSDAALETGESIEFTPVTLPRSGEIEPGMLGAITSRRPRWLPRRATPPTRARADRNPVTGSPQRLAQRMLVHCGCSPPPHRRRHIRARPHRWPIQTSTAVTKQGTRN
jgi:hypothetical protein